MKLTTDKTDDIKIKMVDKILSNSAPLLCAEFAFVTLLSVIIVIIILGFI